MSAPAVARPAPSVVHGPRDGTSDDDLRALIALAALGGPDRLSHEERLALGRALQASPALRAELRALAAVAAALPPAAPAPTITSQGPWSIPEPLRRPAVIAALAAVVLLLGVLRVATHDGGTPAGATVATATAGAVTGAAAIADRPWGTELTLELDGTEPGTTYDVAVFGRAGRTFEVGTFAGSTETVRFAGTTGVARDGLRSVRVTDDAGAVVLRADLE